MCIRIYIFTSFAAFILLQSCANVQTTSYIPSPKASIGSYDAIEIHEFESAVVNFPEEGLIEIPNLIAEKLRDNNTSFKEVAYGEISNTQPQKTLVVLGEISNYVGSGDVRYETGNVKFGEIVINVDIAILQKSNGREIASGEINSFNSASFLGGKGKMFEEIANEVTNYILQNS